MCPGAARRTATGSTPTWSSTVAGSLRWPPPTTSRSRVRADRSGAAAERVLDLRDVEPARGEQHVEVIDEVGRLLDDALVALVQRRHRELDRLLPDLAGAGARPRVEELRGVRALGPPRGTVGDRAPQPGREAGERTCVARRACRAYADEQCVPVAVVPQLDHGERVARRLPFAPEPFAGAAPEPCLAGV